MVTPFPAPLHLDASGSAARTQDPFLVRSSDPTSVTVPILHARRTSLRSVLDCLDIFLPAIHNEKADKLIKEKKGYWNPNTSHQCTSFGSYEGIYGIVE